MPSHDADPKNIIEEAAVQPAVTGPWDSAYTGLCRQKGLAPTKGRVLIMTDDINLVLSLRIRLFEKQHQLVWMGNFWMALSFLKKYHFAGVVLDLTTASVQQDFVSDFLEEYTRHSFGRRIFLKHRLEDAGKYPLLQKKGSLFISKPTTARQLMEALDLPDSNIIDTWHSEPEALQDQQP